jgi:hypothetical protein
MSDHVLPAQKKSKLIIVVAFDRGEDGDLFPAFAADTWRKCQGRG